MQAKRCTSAKTDRVTGCGLTAPRPGPTATPTLAATCLRSKQPPPRELRRQRQLPPPPPKPLLPEPDEPVVAPDEPPAEVPLLSVVPQEIIFRRYLFTRFETIFTPAMMVLVSGLGFGFAHVVFGNWVAPLLCAIGGIMFAQTYARTRSLALVSLEHALYGNFVFTVGLGRYFYHGAVH